MPLAVILTLLVGVGFQCYLTGNLNRLACTSDADANSFVTWTCFHAVRRSPVTDDSFQGANYYYYYYHPSRCLDSLTSLFTFTDLLYLPHLAYDYLALD
ncbi:hypothetical protein DFJ58DRAFT_288532 [Suillus subalutaceus]|uniref:uncharacterized protein n=1 Tax=Suillus subalutaceus TaxID=48586 RepID=UPI001B87382B|nr:uncharacterized protein DFJ58DRAFT_288532 [Suillus subalutaceus]KAG1859350.1 hypothetical protein DFJ58DRAFT_288532 [Suillus subalutaceus]